MRVNLVKGDGEPFHVVDKVIPWKNPGQENCWSRGEGESAWVRTPAETSTTPEQFRIPERCVPASISDPGRCPAITPAADPHQGIHFDPAHLKIFPGILKLIKIGLCLIAVALVESTHYWSKVTHGSADERVG
ncbi:hypothetical protein BV898_03267 [Hypsibius exemplaris]|uniref:Uncharacterized protein n=1 Tax=Hypsibius exemplaris TaxID=2072580 RepID=A0A1W0X632_HYPEX|nr:hypothetical protein BV898_03267 [Hypsibius exemplaris]